MIITGEVKPRRDLKYYDNIQTALLNNENVAGRTQQPQTEAYVFSSANGSEVLAQDIILTAIAFTIAGTESLGAASCVETALINGTQIHAHSINVTTGSQNSSIIVPIPNWFLPAGTTLQVTQAHTCDGLDADVSFIGYVA